MNLDKCFELELKENPTDDKMLIYADWLEEQGKECKADAIRRLISDVHNDDNIDELKDWQQELLPLWKSYWIYVGLNTHPANRTAAEAAVDELYKNVGLETPKLKIWLDSPLAGCIGVTILNQVSNQVGNQVIYQVISQVRDQLRNQVISQVSYQVWSQVRDQVCSQVIGQVSNQVINQVWGQVISQVSYQVWIKVWRQVRDQVSNQSFNNFIGSQVSNQVWRQLINQLDNQVSYQVSYQVRGQRNQLYQCGYGQHDASWLAFYNFLSAVVGYHTAYRLKPYWQLARNCGCWWPFSNAIILTERPTEINFDDQGRLQSILYRDEFNVQFNQQMMEEPNESRQVF